jgi:plastocyanin
LTVTARVGDTIIFTANGTHPLRFDAGTATCIYAGVTANQTYPVTATGTYYFHCQNHGSGCSGGNSACGSTSCTAMAGVLTVTP